MKFCSSGALYAMQRPDTSVRLEGCVIWRVPIPSSKDAGSCHSEYANILVQNGHDLITFRNRQSSTGTEISLNVHDYESIGLTYSELLQTFILNCCCLAIERGMEALICLSE